MAAPIACFGEQDEIEKNLRQKYLKSAGLPETFPEDRIQTDHLSSDQSSVVYFVVAKNPEGVPIGPPLVLKHLLRENQFIDHRIEFPTKVIAVFAKTNWDLFGANLDSIQSLEEVIAVPIPRYEDRLWLYASLQGFPLLPGTGIAGKIIARNNGTQFPWWSWSMIEPELIPLNSGIDFPTAALSRNPKGWIQKQRGSVSFNLVPIALLDDHGKTIQGGAFSPSEWLTKLPDKTRFTPPQNPFQERFFSMFYPLPKNLVEMKIRRKEFSLSNSDEFLSIRIALPNGEIATLQPWSLRVQQRELHKNFSIGLIIETLEGITIEFTFQNNLPNLVNRTIFFAEERHYEGPIRVGFRGEPLVETQMVSFKPLPVKRGLTHIWDWILNRKDGLLSGLKADLYFETQAFTWMGKDIASARVFVQFNLPKDSLFPHSEIFSGRDLRILRPGFESYYPTESGSDDDIITVASHMPCGKTFEGLGRD